MPPIEDQLDLPDRTLFASSFALSILVPCLLHLYFAYRAFKALGPGGTPQTIPGFLKVHALSFLQVPNPYELDASERIYTFHEGHLRNLPSRRGLRPATRGIAPHRQVTQKCTKENFAMLVTEIEKLGNSSDDLRIGTSCFEMHSTGLFVKDPIAKTCAGEACHAHPSDGGSMHLTLHSSDVKIVLDAGWGERHPLARGGWFERFVPAGFVLVYAPRDAGELRTVMEIVGAAVRHVSDGSLW